MRTLRVGIAAAATVAATFALPASAHLDPPAGLAGVTTVTADHSGSAKVVLYDDALVKWKPVNNPDTTIDGDGRFVGLWLTRDDGYQSGEPGIDDWLTVYRLPAFAGGKTRTFGSAFPTEHCTNWPSDEAPLKSTCDGFNPKGILLHQGYYKLTVVTDGSPVRFTLDLNGADGTTTIHPTNSFRTVQNALQQRDGIGDNLVTWGHEESNFTDAARLLQFVDLSWSDDATARGAGECVRFDDKSAQPPLAYGPMCLGGSGGSGGYVINAGPEQIGGVWVWGSSPSDGTGDLGLGGSAWSDKSVSFHRALGVWIDGSCEECWAW